jgi:glycosyltransferase involved in cell wall biosynthesis
MRDNATPEPLVSVVTPVYNGERYLSQCIESVLAQTYRNWEYIIVNNCSTDRTREIAESYARNDARIRVHDNAEFVGIIRNHNIGFGQLSPASKYCKLLHADDWLFPNCIASMVHAAEANSSIGMVGAYSLHNERVKCDGLPYPSTVMPGREIGRLTLRGEVYVFLSPTCLLIRSDLIRGAAGAFYNESHIYADLEACFEVLQHCDLGFVHQVLTYVRAHEGSMTASHAERLNTYLPAWLDMLTRFGPAYLDGEEHQRLVRRRLHEYYRFLSKNIFRLGDRQFWQFHKRALADLSYPLSWTRLVAAAIAEAVAVLLSPVRTVRRALAR